MFNIAQIYLSIQRYSSSGSGYNPSKVETGFRLPHTANRFWFESFSTIQTDKFKIDSM